MLWYAVVPLVRSPRQTGHFVFNHMAAAAAQAGGRRLGGGASGHGKGVKSMVWQAVVDGRLHTHYTVHATQTHTPVGCGVVWGH